MGAETDPNVVHHNRDAAEIFFVLAHEFELLESHVDGEIFQHGQIQQHIGPVYSLHRLQSRFFKLVEVFQRKFIIERHIQAVILLSDGNHLISSLLG